jgi:cell wall-associated NlpC family hydrolase
MAAMPVRPPSCRPPCPAVGAGGPDAVAPTQPRRRPRRPRLAALALAAGIAVGSTGIRAQEAPATPAVDGGVTARARAAAHSALEGAQGLANHALSLLGVKYKFGGTRPETGLDCSGLVQYVFQQVTGVTLPRTAREMSRLGDKVALAELVPGDLVFFNTRRFAYSHVGIYLGDNRFIHAPRRGREVEIAEIDRRYWQQRFDGARRLAGSVPGLLPSLIGEAAASPLPAAAGEAAADFPPGARIAGVPAGRPHAPPGADPTDAADPTDPAELPVD